MKRFFTVDCWLLVADLMSKRREKREMLLNTLARNFCFPLSVFAFFFFLTNLLFLVQPTVVSENSPKVSYKH